MDHLYLPPALRHFVPLRPGSVAASNDAPLAYDLVAALRPRLVVDVGAGGAGAWTIFAQSMRDHDVDGLVYAVDPFHDDGAKAEDDETRSEALQQFLHTHFRGVAYLMKMEATSALRHFSSGSVDLLRLDPTRVEVALPDLLGAWLPRLAPGGVLLCAGLRDTALRATFAEQVGEAGLCLASGTFVHRRPGAPGAELLGWLSSGEPEIRADLAAYYDHAARHHALRAEIHERGGLFRKKAGGRP